MNDLEVANFRIISRKVIDTYCSMEEKRRFFGAHKECTAYIYVEYGASSEGKITYPLRKLINLAMDTIIAYSDTTLRLSIKTGLTVVCFSFFYALYPGYRNHLLAIPVERWTSFMVSICCLGGLLISNLGIIGIYLGKVFNKTKMRPLYVISKRINL